VDRDDLGIGIQQWIVTYDCTNILNCCAPDQGEAAVSKRLGAPAKTRQADGGGGGKGLGSSSKGGTARAPDPDDVFEDAWAALG
jgi:hypothetical protein